MLEKRDFTIRVDPCIDVDRWVWSILDEYNGVRLDGYSSTEEEAWEDARKARDEEIKRLNEEE